MVLMAARHGDPRQPGSADATAGQASLFNTAVERLLFWIVLASLLLCCLAWSLPALPLAFLLPKRFRAPVGQYTAMIWCRCFLWVAQATGRVHCDLRALDTLRAEDHLVIAPNHPSLIDALLVISRLPRITCIAKASLWNNFFFGAGIRLAGYVRNDAPRQLLREAGAAVRAPGSRQMLIFPEGTRSPPGQLGSFQPGFAAIAKLAGADVQTVFIETNSAYMSKGWPIFRMPRFPVVYRVSLGQRFTPSGGTKAFTAGLEQYVRAELGQRKPLAG
jgi:1-acyl-sn-glycerol-3-phosphate acyltransferase